MDLWIYLHTVELVWAVRSSVGGAMRITVDSNYQMHYDEKFTKD